MYKHWREHVTPEKKRQKHNQQVPKVSVFVIVLWVTLLDLCVSPWRRGQAKNWHTQWLLVIIICEATSIFATAQTHCKSLIDMRMEQLLFCASHVFLVPFWVMSPGFSSVPVSIHRFVRFPWHPSTSFLCGCVCRFLAWLLRQDDTRKSRSVTHSKGKVFFSRHILHFHSLRFLFCARPVFAVLSGWCLVSKQNLPCNFLLFTQVFAFLSGVMSSLRCFCSSICVCHPGAGAKLKTDTHHQIGKMWIVNGNTQTCDWTLGHMKNQETSLRKKTPKKTCTKKKWVASKKQQVCWKIMFLSLST